MKALLILFALSLTMVGCSTIDHPRTDGSIIGRVILFDSTRAVLDDFSGIRVSIDGTNKSTLTDPSGRWEFADLTDDTYDVTATKPGFGTFHWYQQVISGGRIDEFTAALAQMPSYTPEITGLNYDSAFQYIQVISYPPKSMPTISIACYCDLDSNVQPSDPHLAVAYNLNWSEGGGTLFSREDLRAVGVRPGQRLYFSTASVFVRSNSYSTKYEFMFTDPYHNFATRYASNGPKSNVVSAVMQ